MLSLGLTGGIAAGKSLLAKRFRELGAVVIDADRLAREVVAPGTPGLSAVVGQFGAQILLPDGSLDRAQLGAIVFADKDARESLNAIVHPLVRAAAKALKDDAGPGRIVVQDIPLLVETGQGVNFHLVVVAQAPRDVRVARMVRDRGMTEADALARIAAQATDEERAAVADVLIVNDGTPEQAIKELDALWRDRLVPFAANLAAGVPAGTSREAPMVPRDYSWPAQTARLAARIKHALGESVVSVVHVGATAVQTPAAPDVLEFQVQLSRAGGSLLSGKPSAGGSSRDPLSDQFAAAGFVPAASTPQDLAEQAATSSRWFASADPGRWATVEVRAVL